MSKSNNIQPGHYRTYRESGKTITVNGGPSSSSGLLDSNIWIALVQLIVGIAVWIYI